MKNTQERFLFRICRVDETSARAGIWNSRGVAPGVLKVPSGVDEEKADKGNHSPLPPIEVARSMDLGN
jgi:hypothetical protein